MFGTQIGLKFNQCGSPAAYPGNTVVADINPDSPAYPVLIKTLEEIDKAELSPLLIKLPVDSYHVTIMRGLNHRIRTPEFWPPELPVDAPLSEMARFVKTRLEGIAFPASFAMKIESIQWNDEDVRVHLAPATDEAKQTLRALRDRMADALGFRLPGHDGYAFHATLAYVLHRAQEEDSIKIARIIDEFRANHSGRLVFELPAPYLAFYEDMMKFSRERGAANRG